MAGRAGHDGVHCGVGMAAFQSGRRGGDGLRMFWRGLHVEPRGHVGEECGAAGPGGRLCPYGEGSVVAAFRVVREVDGLVLRCLLRFNTLLVLS